MSEIKEKKTTVTFEDVHRIFDYRDGKLYWKIKHSHKVIQGAEAGYTNYQGYRVVMVNYKLYSVHRLVFFMHHGYWPLLTDHIDRNRGNNCIENLRESNKSENALNSSLHGRRRKHV